MHAYDVDVPVRGHRLSMTMIRPLAPRADDESDYGHAATVFSRTGGLATGDHVARLMRAQCSQPVSLLARWIVTRTVVSFERLGQRLLPLFQFDPVAMTPRHGVGDLVRALSESLDEWETALWFARANPRLEGATPADVIDQDDGIMACRYATPLLLHPDRGGRSLAA